MLLVIIAVMCILALLSKRSNRWHFVHKFLRMNCISRTNRSRQLRFEGLQRFWIPGKNVARPLTKNDVVTFDFTKAHKGSLVIEIPPKSGWYTLRHTHEHSDSCSKITNLSGRWFIGSATWATPGPAPPEKPRSWTSMGKQDPSNDTASARLDGTIAARILDHLLCSLVQDAEVYFCPCTTPTWIRTLYAITKVSPALREIVVHRVLWVQIRATLHKHDFIEDHGTITIFRWINPWSPPEWVDRFEERMRFVRSRTISQINYWLGIYVMGMRVCYKEYVPAWSNGVDVKSKNMITK